MSEPVLGKVVEAIERNPHGANSLLLYALVSTLNLEKSGCMFKLIKLRDMDADTRALAFGLMELMANGGNTGPEWQKAVAHIDEVIRNA
jgi:hypothetical protein